MHGDFPGLAGLGPTPADRAPVKPEEEQELADFARDNVPGLGRNIERLRRERPEEFRRRLNDIAPRLRFLKRLHAENPELAQRVIGIAENFHKLRRLRRAWNGADPPARRHIMREARAAIQENLESEAAIVQQRIDSMRAGLDDRIEAEFGRLTRPDVEIAAEPEEVQAALDQLAGAPEDQRPELQNQLRTVLRGQFEADLELLERRREHLEANASRELERRLRAMFPIDPAGPPSPRRVPP